GLAGGVRVVDRKKAPAVLLALAEDAEEVLRLDVIAVGAPLRVLGAKELLGAPALAGNDSATFIRSVLIRVRNDLVEEGLWKGERHQDSPENMRIASSIGGCISSRRIRSRSIAPRILSCAHAPQSGVKPSPG